MRLAIVTAEPLPDYSQAVFNLLCDRGHSLEVIDSPQFDNELPDAAWMRVVPGSWQHQVPPYWQAAQLLEACGVPLLNPLFSHELAANKLVAHEIFRRDGIAQPRTYRAEEALRLADHEQLILKPQFGSRGRGIVSVASAAEAAERLAELGEPALLQQRIDTVRCLRVIASPDKVHDCYEKRGEPGELVLSVYLGAKRVPVAANGEIARLAMRACKLLSGRLMGIDILEDTDGRLWLLEANASFAFDTENADLVSAFAGEVERLARKSVLKARASAG